ncbi:MAG: hypothetical protein ACI3YG_07175, partial [Prevotella sp.]
KALKKRLRRKNLITTQLLRCDVTRSKTPSKTAKNKEKRYNRLITKVLTQNRVKSLIFAFLRARESLIENIQF